MGKRDRKREEGMLRQRKRETKIGSGAGERDQQTDRVAHAVANL